MVISYKDQEESGALTTDEITLLLESWRMGDLDAINHVIAMVYHDLRRIARTWLGHMPRDTLQPTALVHEVYHHLVDHRQLVFNDRAHFFRCACLIMRQISLKYARLRMAQKRGRAGAGHVALEPGFVAEETLDPATILAVQNALKRIKAADPRLHDIVELKFFLGMNFKEIAEILQTSTRTARREWQTAKVWLAHELKTR